MNGVAQQGLVRFAVHSLAPNAYGPTGLGSPSAAQTASHRVAVTVTTAYDPDDGTLTYSLIRDGNTAAPVARATAPTVGFWLQTNRPAITLTDRPAPTGVHSYEVVVTDAGRGAATSVPTSIRVK